MPRPTSTVAWNALVASGRLSSIYQKVIQALLTHGDCTAKEIERHSQHPGIWKRTSELRDDGLIIELRVRTCNVTGELAIEWSLPADPPSCFNATFVYYRVEGFVGYKNHIWLAATKCFELRRNKSSAQQIDKAYRNSFKDVEFVKVTKRTRITESEYKESPLRV
jgi:hypothetical protein